MWDFLLVLVNGLFVDNYGGMVGKYEGIVVFFVLYFEVVDEVGLIFMWGEVLMVNKKVLVCCGIGIVIFV